MTGAGVAFLWDIDGTLLTVGHHGRNSFCRAIGEICGVDHTRLNLQMAGRTDLSITKEALDFFQIPQNDLLIRKIWDRYLELLKNALNRPDSLIVYPGAAALLAELQKRGALQGLGTGNMLAGARLKMELAGLWPYIQAGGYGDDHILRPEVLAIGRRRLLATAPAATTWVIGDTPLDIQAGQAIGAKTCAIANGRYSTNELAAYKPDLCFHDLNSAHEPLCRLLNQPFV